MSSLATLIALDIFKNASYAPVVATIVITITILFFGEIFRKHMQLMHSN